MPEPLRLTGVVLGFDFGTRRIGIAVGQTVTRTASAVATLTSRDGGPDWTGIGRLIEQWRPTALVVGVPLRMDGTEHELTRLARRFGNRLQGRYHLPVFCVDERLTSVEAERLLDEAGALRREDKATVDSVAAQLLLQSWLNQIPDQTRDAQGKDD